MQIETNMRIYGDDAVWLAGQLTKRIYHDERGPHIVTPGILFESTDEIREWVLGCIDVQRLIGQVQRGHLDLVGAVIRELIEGAWLIYDGEWKLISDQAEDGIIQACYAVAAQMEEAHA